MTSLATSDNKAFGMAVRKNLKEFEPKEQEECKRLETVLGFPVAFEFHLTPEQLAKAYRGYDERAGFFAHAHLKGVVDTLIARDLKDDMVKEGFQEALTAKKIILACTEGVDGNNARWAIKDGALRIEYGPTAFGYNCDTQYVQGCNKLEKLL